MRAAKPRLKPRFAELTPGWSNAACRNSQCAASAGVGGTTNVAAALPLPVPKGTLTSGPTSSSQPGMPIGASDSGSDAGPQFVRDEPSISSAARFTGRFEIVSVLANPGRIAGAMATVGAPPVPPQDVPNDWATRAAGASRVPTKT